MVAGKPVCVKICTRFSSLKCIMPALQSVSKTRPTTYPSLPGYSSAPSLDTESRFRFLLDDAADLLSFLRNVVLIVTGNCPAST